MQSGQIPWTARPNWPYWVALILGAAIAGLFLLAVMPALYPYSEPDATEYLEAARNYLSGNGFRVSALLDQLPMATVPLAQWPPGYPMIIALCAKMLSVSPIWVAPKIAWLCWSLMPVALLYCLRPVLDDKKILLIAALTMLAPGTIDMAPQAMSDVPFMLLTTLSIALFVRGAVVRIDWRLLVLSGFVGGLCYSVRNVGLAWLGAGFLACFIFSLMRRWSPGTAARVVLLWLLGASAVLVPLEFFNLGNFGTLNPYRLPPSTLGLASNIRYYAIALFDDLSGRPELRHDFLWNNAILMAALALSLAIAILFRNAIKRNWRLLSAQQQDVLILLLLNIIAGSTIVILARTRYQWGELINTRHTMQYDWMVLSIVLILLVPLARSSIRVLLAGAIVSLTLLGLRFDHALGEITMSRAQYAASLGQFSLSQIAEAEGNADRALMVQRIRDDGQLLRAISSLPPQTLLISNRVEPLRVETGRPVTRILIDHACLIPKEIAVAVRDKPSLFLLVPEKELVRSGCWRRLANLADPDALPVARPYLSVLSANAAARFH